MNIAARAARALGLIETRSQSEGNQTPAGVLPPPRERAGKSITTREALSLEAVFRAVQVLSVGVSQLSIGVWRGDDELDPAPSLVRKPDVSAPDATRESFLEETTTALALSGNCFWRKHSARRGDPITSLEVLPTQEVGVRTDPARPTWRRYHWRGQEFTSAEIAHLKFMRIPGQPYGLGPIQAAATGLRGAVDARDYGSGWFEDSGVPSGVLSTDQTITREEAREWSKEWSEYPAGQTRVVGKGMSYQALGLKPADVQFLESQEFSVTQVARLFGIPAGYVLAAIEGTSQTYSNQEQIDIAFVRFTLMSYLREIEATLTGLLPNGQTARFKIDALLRTDTKTRYEAHQIAIGMGLYDLAHAQRIEGLPTTTHTPALEPTNA